jgi:hypothetical protein
MKRESFKLPSAPTLAHFTRASGKSSALDNLLWILEDNLVRGSTRMLLGGQRGVCLFDTPPHELGHLLTPRNRRRYEPFGVAVDKRYAFSMGARPVIYMPSAEAAAILNHDEMWRVVSIDMTRNPPIDWTFEREWRVRGDLALRPQFSVALVASWRDADEIYERFNGKPPCAGVIPLGEIFETR